MGSSMTCKEQYCCGNRYNCTGPEDPPLPEAALSSQQVAEPFGYWCECKGADPVLLRKPSYIPEPNHIHTVTPLYAIPVPAPAGEPAITRDAVLAQLCQMERDGSLVVYSTNDDRGLDLDEYADLFMSIRSALLMHGS